MKERKLRKIFKVSTFMSMTETISKLSYDKKHKVGSILVSKDFRIINSIGYNGNYIGGDNERNSLESGKSGFLHAEENLLISKSISHKETKDYVLYVTMTPCDMCAKRIVNGGVKKVITLNKYVNCGDTYEILKKAKVKIIYLMDYLKDNLQKYYKDLNLNNKDNKTLNKLMKHLLNVIFKDDINTEYKLSKKYSYSKKYKDEFFEYMALEFYNIVRHHLK